MVILDKSAQKALKSIYTQFGNKSELVVSAQEYRKTTIDFLIKQGLLEKVDVSTLSGWTYIVRPTHEGELSIAEASALSVSKVENFIARGQAIMKEEYHRATPEIAMPDYISGPKSDQWFSEISIFNNRELKDHPLHDQIENDAGLLRMELL